MRLINADKLSADMYHEAFEKDSDMQKWDSGCWIRYKMFENVLKAQPAVQPDIIRCKDCKHWNPQLKTANGNGLGSCDFHNVALVTSEGFCYWAERGEQNDSEAD